MPRGIYPRPDITQKRFERLIPIKFLYRKGKVYYWLFQCDCGKKTVTTKQDVVSKHTRSCGCLKKETLTKHGMNGTRFYNIWRAMVQRITNPKCESWKYYGKRNIKIEWKSFHYFRDDMHESYVAHVKEFGEKQTTIDRIDNNGNYSKKNCKWATYSEQNKNRRRDILMKNNRSGYVGISWHKNVKKWNARITFNSNRIDLGCFSDIKDAVSARIKALQK